MKPTKGVAFGLHPLCFKSALNFDTFQSRSTCLAALMWHPNAHAKAPNALGSLRWACEVERRNSTEKTHRIVPSSQPTHFRKQYAGGGLPTATLRLARWTGDLRGARGLRGGYPGQCPVVAERLERHARNRRGLRSRWFVGASAGVAEGDR